MSGPDPIGVGFVGAGWMGRALLARLVEHEDVTLRALCQRDRAGAERALSETGLPADLWTDDYASMLDDPTVDAVFVCTPNSLHGPQSIAALEAGKHVFCEKPCATQFSEFIRQIELERDRPELVNVVDYILEFDPMERILRRMIEEGAFGRLTQVQVNYRHPVNIEGSKAWKLEERLIGDAIAMGIVHALWVMIRAMELQARPVAVFATSAPARVRPFEVDPIWTIQVRFDDGTVGVCLGDIDGARGYDLYHGFFGTEGAFVFDSLAEPPAKVRLRSRASTADRWVYPLDRERCRRDGIPDAAWDDHLTTPDSGDVFRHQTGAAVAHFLDCIRAGRQSPLSFANTQSVAAVGWAARISAAQGRLVALPLERDAAARFFATAGPTG